jgi:hypothetical protein
MGTYCKGPGPDSGPEHWRKVIAFDSYRSRSVGILSLAVVFALVIWGTLFLLIVLDYPLF